MKTDVMPSIIKMDKEELLKLVTEVKETVATVIDLPGDNKKTFGPVDMWNIRRNFKSASDMMRRR
ncbi:MAG: hypothetical protein Q8941_16260 [Bacteroidota bacterium]|nr:hypothetical protein [Bacteroidota bacterium]